MAKIKPPINEGLGTLVGRALLFLSGAGKEYKKLRKDFNDPEFKKRWNSMQDKVDDLTKEYQQILRDFR